MESESCKEEECLPSNLRCSLGISAFAAQDIPVTFNECEVKSLSRLCSIDVRKGHFCTRQWSCHPHSISLHVRRRLERTIESTRHWQSSFFPQRNPSGDPIIRSDTDWGRKDRQKQVLFLCGLRGLVVPGRNLHVSNCGLSTSFTTTIMQHLMYVGEVTVSTPSVQHQKKVCSNQAMGQRQRLVLRLLMQQSHLVYCQWTGLSRRLLHCQL